MLLVTDGVAGSDSDLWVRQRFAAFEGESPKDLTQALIDESAGHGGRYRRPHRAGAASGKAVRRSSKTLIRGAKPLPWEGLTEFRRPQAMK